MFTGTCVSRETADAYAKRKKKKLVFSICLEAIMAFINIAVIDADHITCTGS